MKKNKNLQEQGMKNKDQILIEKTDDDIFDHYKIAKNIYDLIYGLKLSSIGTSYSIGLVGEWGIGKSGIINILKTIWLKNRSDILFYEFNPWNFEKSELINKFFYDVSKELGISNIGDLLKEYSDLIGKVESTGMFNITISKFFPEKTINQIKDEINKKLERYDKKIIILIDDLDRCGSDEIILMLNLVKNLGNFKNIIYLISYDKDNVLKALVSNDFSQNYLDKIVNTEVFVSTPNSEQLKEYFVKGIKKIFENVLKDDKTLNDEEKNKFIQQQIQPFYEEINSLDGGMGFYSNINSIFKKENLRFLKKLLNQLNISIQKNFELKEDFEKNIIFGKKFNLNLLIVINYVKIKDFNYYNFVLNILKIMASGKDVTGEDLPNFYKKGVEEFLKYDFLICIAKINISTTTNYFVKLPGFYEDSHLDIEKYS